MRDSYDFYNGYGGRSFVHPTTGLYFNGDWVWLLLNKDDPQRYYGFIPMVDTSTDPTAKDFGVYEQPDFSSITTDFKNYLDRRAIDTTSNARIETYVKRVEEEGFEQN